ncbi:Protein of unknown function (DUF1688) [seawater metagenome]|uniref:Uncharacterized protein n=1 Tax=seawater metagenome TaxID=1561972 RepID=A0A5E8CIR5_9ZZZZ
MVSWKILNKDYNQRKYIGFVGADNSDMYVLAKAKYDIDIYKNLSNKSPDEFVDPDLDYLIKKNIKKKNINKIVSLNPYGLYSNAPSIAAVRAKLDLKNIINYTKDGNIVDENGLVNCLKVAINYTWYLNGIATRLGINEDKLRNTFYEYYKNSDFLDYTKQIYLPNLGGISLFVFGDLKKLEDKKTEITVRIHDACLNSDCFRGTICTCSPYLMWAIENCIQTAQKGGVGIIFYFKKEGRCLGEVVKFRVYSARAGHKDGDVSEKYFMHTKNIAGIEDIRFQELMPDPLLWLGIKKITNLYSMSNIKYSALNKMGIYAENRYDLPLSLIPPQAHVEIDAKIKEGYFANENNLKDISKTRELCHFIYNYVENNQSKYFKINSNIISKQILNLGKFIKERYPNFSPTNHSRLEHLLGWKDLVKSWKCSLKEKIMRMIDLIFVSVFLDAGAGNEWSYKLKDKKYTRSEGIGMAVMNMFISGCFSDDIKQPFRVDAKKLIAFKVQNIKEGFQYTTKNKIIGIEGRHKNLVKLGHELLKNKHFGNDDCRPGNILKECFNDEINLESFYKAIFSLSNVSNDIGHHKNLNISVPYHKLLQWLSYSLLDLFEEFRIHIPNNNYLTALPEYRNAGFLIDTQIIELKNKDDFKKSHNMLSDFVIELRALTVHLIDIIHKKFNELHDTNLTMSQVLQGGTWALGRKLAEKRNGDPPLIFDIKGTIF